MASSSEPIEQLPDLAEGERFIPVYCDCGKPLFDGFWTGVIRLLCRNCGLRIWVGRNADETRILAKDRPNRRILPSRPTEQ